MVKPVYNLPQDDLDDAAAARHWLSALPENYPESDRRRLAETCDLLVSCRVNQRLETGETQFSLRFHYYPNKQQQEPAPEGEGEDGAGTPEEGSGDRQAGAEQDGDGAVS
jgi:hypothetical protein